MPVNYPTDRPEITFETIVSEAGIDAEDSSGLDEGERDVFRDVFEDEIMERLEEDRRELIAEYVEVEFNHPAGFYAHEVRHNREPVEQWVETQVDDDVFDVVDRAKFVTDLLSGRGSYGVQDDAYEVASELKQRLQRAGEINDGTPTTDRDFETLFSEAYNDANI